jgi:hypothetical protein
MNFEDQLNTLVQKVAKRAAKDENLRQLSGSLDYWKEQNERMKAGLSYALLTPWIFLGDNNA